MRAAVDRVDRVRERVHGLVEPVVVLDGAFDDVAIDFALHVHRLEVDRFALPVHVPDKALDAALEVVVDFLAGPLVAEVEPDLLGQECVHPQPLGLDSEVEIDALEDRCIRLEAHRGAVVPRARQFHRGQFVERHAAGVLLSVHLACLVRSLRRRVRDNLNQHVLGKGIHHARANAVQPARDLVPAAAELAARMEYGHDRLDRCLARLLLDVDGDATAVVGDAAPAVCPDNHLHPVAVTRHRLVDRVVDELLDQVVEAGLVGRADVHPGPAPDGFKPFEYLDVLSGVGRRRCLCGHSRMSYPWRASPPQKGRWRQIVRLPSQFIRRGVPKPVFEAEMNPAKPPTTPATTAARLLARTARGPASADGSPPPSTRPR